MDLASRVSALEAVIQQLQAKRTGKQGIMPGVIIQQMVANGYALLQIDLAKNRPSIATPACIFFFARDTGVLSVWNNGAWVSSTAFS